MRFYHFDSDDSPLAEWDHDLMKGIDTLPALRDYDINSKRPQYLTLMLHSSKCNDFIWSYYNECIITEKAAELLAREKLTGYHLEPVIISKIKYGRNHDVSKLPKMFELQLRGWAGMAHPDSGIRLVKETPERLKYCYYTDPTKLIDESQWDGSDFFMVWPMPAFIFMTEKVKAILEREKLTGFKIISPDQLPPAEYPGFPFNPGRLRQWFPDEMAHKLGDPLGIY